MFGYVTIFKPELKVREFQTFQAYYCGLCKEIGTTYGQLPRGLISYDCTFLYLLLASFLQERETYEKGRCPTSPLKKKRFAQDVYREYAAAVNVLLGVNGIRDKKQDSKNPLYGVAAGTLRGAYKKAKNAYPELADNMEKNLLELNGYERENSVELDAVAHTFGMLLGTVFAYPGAQQNIMFELGYGLGRFIYLIDAVDDMEEDEKKGNYNPFLLGAGDMDKPALMERASYNLHSTLNTAVLAYDLLDIVKHKEILDNIVYLGLPEQVKRVKNKLGREE